MSGPAIADPVRRRQAADLGMWVFLGSEALFFGVLMLAFLVYRLAYPETFGAAAGHLDRDLGGLNTAVLLTSSLTMALADRAAEDGRRRALLGTLALTAVLGIAFLVVKAYEWREEVHEHLAPLRRLAFDFPGEAERHAEMFFNLYFAMTGVHALHLVIGIGLLIWLLLRVAARGGASPQVRATGLYWHFVDVVWILLYPVLYLLR